VVFGKEKISESNIDPTSLEVSDKEELAEIYKIKDRLDSDEKVHIVARQSRIKPGSSIVVTPNIVFATDRRIIIRNPTMLGLRENFEDYSYDKITNIKLERGIFSSTLVITAPGMGTSARTGLSEGLVAWGRGEDGMIDAIPKEKAELILKLVRYKMEEIRKQKTQPVQQTSTADEIAKLAKLKEQGILTEEEFTKMKQDLIKRLS
jgi:hypothetical protein